MKYILFFLGTLFYVSISHSQKNNEYLIFTFNVSQNKGVHKDSNYYWIINKDSLNQTESLAPLYIESFSKTDLMKCKSNQTVYPFDVFEGEDFNFDESYLYMQKELPKIIFDNRKSILSVSKKFNKGFKEKICVYVTSVIGEFCKSKIDKETSKKIRYKGYVYFPLKKIRINNNFNIDKLNLYELHSKMNLSSVSNIPWR